MASLLARQQAAGIRLQGSSHTRIALQTRALPDRARESSGVHPALLPDDQAQRYIAWQDLPASLQEAVLKTVPVTALRPPPDPERLTKSVPNPGMPRAYKAVTAECPDGSPEMPHPDWNNMTVVQKHVAFWDRDGDGIIWPGDTFIGFKRLGFNLLLCCGATVALHIVMAGWTQEGFPDLRLPFHIKNMHKAKHGSDTETYDTEGRFVPQKFEEIFSKYDQDRKGGLSWEDIQAMAKGNRKTWDPAGWGSERAEWSVFWLLAKDENGIVSKEKTRAMFDGSLFYQVADELEKKDRLRKESGKRVPPSVLGREREREEVMARTERSARKE